METPVLEGPGVRLEPLTLAHLPALEAIAFDPTIWRYTLHWISTPAHLRAWVETALETPNTLPWVTIKRAAGTDSDTIVGSTRFLDLSLQHKTVEIGSTWIGGPWRGSRINTEAKLLQLSFAFDALKMNRVCFKVHVLNRRVQSAIKAIGAHPEGTFRNHYVMPDGSLRDSMWFSIIRSEWPDVKDLLQRRLAAPCG